MSYNEHLKKNYAPILVSRTVPIIGVSLVFSILARNDSDGLAIFAYTLALFSIISAITSMCLSAAGNVIAAPSQDKHSSQATFSAGLFLSCTIAATATLLSIALASMISWFPGAQTLCPYTITYLALIYTACIPMAVINTFLHLFHEGAGNAAACAKTKTFATCAGIAFLIPAWIYGEEHLLAIGMSYFVVIELITFLTLIIFSRARGLSIAPRYNARTTAILFKLGLPVAIGLAGQKLYFYLLNERMAVLDTNLISQLSVFMTLSGLLLLPYVALGQAHSLYISKTLLDRHHSYWMGLSWLCLITLIFATVGVLLGEWLLEFVGGSVLVPSGTLFITLLLFLFSNGLLSLAMGHLRGAGDTLTPQIAVNVMIFSTLIPVVYLMTPQVVDVAWYMNIQSIALLCVSLGLGLRIWLIQHSSSRLKAKA